LFSDPFAGARSDLENFCYSFSSETQRQWERSSKYPAQSEILGHLTLVKDRLGLRGSMGLESLRAGVEGVHFDQAGDHWEVHTDSGRSACEFYAICIAHRKEGNH
jgi:cation diffusion facilitator CzcD-associated flavoprotein CzcO